MAAGAAILIVLYLLYRQLVPIPQAGPTRGSESAGVTASRPAQPVERLLLPAFGEVLVRGRAGREIFRTTTAILGGGWLALPVAALLGGGDLTFEADGAAAVRITEGAWASGNPVVFLKAGSGTPPGGLELAAWRPSLPVDWYPSRSTEPPLRLEVSVSRRTGSFAGFPSQPDIRLPGVFLQEGAVVGWTFGEPFDQAYLWAGAPAAGSPPAISVDRFISAVSSDSREGYFRRLFDSGTGASPAAELEALARGFRLAPLLAPEDLPADLRQPVIVGKMDAIASGLIRSGRGDEVARILDDTIIMASADPVLARDAVLGLAEKQDYNRTIRRLETIERDVFTVRGPAPPELAEVKSRLYKDWLRKIIEEGDYYSGAVAYDEARRAFPDDPEIHLLGVEIAIADKDPGRAKEILGARSYPPPLKEWADRLTAQLDDKRGEAEDIIIRFDPGQDSIIVEAVINGSLTQKFIVDTGASHTTIPSSTAVALKIKYYDGMPSRAAATASGVRVAYEVTLESIQLDKCRVDNVTALVLDMPLLPDYGLLGLNFLDAFSAEIDRKNGVLKLKKRPT